MKTANTSELSPLVKIMMKKLSKDEKLIFLQRLEQKRKSVGIAYLFLLVVGFLIPGAHYAYMGKWGTAALFLFTLGGCGIWWLVDVFRTPSMVSDYNDTIASDIIFQIELTK